MYNTGNTGYIKELYEKIFIESVVNSKEFTTFVDGNPHPLRIKIEEEIVMINDELMVTTNTKYANRLVVKRNLLKELDKLIMEYIENNTI